MRIAEILVKQEKPLQLQEGYQLSFKTIDNRYDRVELELQKDGIVVDAKAALPQQGRCNFC